MIINFLSGTSGAANYYINGTKEKARDKEKIEIDRQAALDIAFKIAKQTEDKKNAS